LIARKDGKVMKTLKARDTRDNIGYAEWASADPGRHRRAVSFGLCEMAWRENNRCVSNGQQY
jgi:hypothetical protein